MNNYRGKARKRSQNLLIVEGHHGLLTSFLPKFNTDNIRFRRTNIKNILKDWI